MRRRRIVIKIIALLAAGAALNVAVAWGCVAFDHADNGALTSTTFRFNAADTTFPNQWCYIGVWKSWWTTTVVSEYVANQHFSGYDDSCRVLPPKWARRIMQPSDSFRAKRSFYEATWLQANGWPCRSLVLDGELLEDRSRRTRYSLAFRTETVNIFSELPLRPLIPGFAINTLFYAGVLWVLFCGPFALRRMIRRRRGRCPACAYPIGQSPVCTECGAALTLPSKAAMP